MMPSFCIVSLGEYDMVSWQALLFVGLGGFFGANVRYILSFVLTEGIAKLTGWRLPFGTAFVNITGSFLLAVFLYWAGRRAGFPDSVRLLVGTGFFGAYTTFSTYANASINLILGGE